MTERELSTAMQAKGIIRWDSSDVIRLHFQKKRLYIEPLAKPTLNKINRHKNRLSDLQFRGFARGSDNWNKKICELCPKKEQSLGYNLNRNPVTISSQQYSQVVY